GLPPLCVFRFTAVLKTPQRHTKDAESKTASSRSLQTGFIMDRAVVDQLRAQFPALARQVNGRPVVYLDGPAGTQVPERVASAVGRYLLHSNANTGGRFATSLETDDLMVRARK